MDNNENMTINNPMGIQPIGKLLRDFAVPSVIAMLVNSLYNIVDQIFIGQGVGYLGNAATVVAFPIVTIVLAISMMIGTGGSAYASIKLGEKKFDVAEKVLGNMNTLLIVLGVLFSLVCFLVFEPMLRLFGAQEAVMPYAKDYTSIILIGVPFMMVGSGLSNMARADGNPRLSMFSMLVGAALNTILDPIYIFVFHWGVKGAAIATITSQIISVVVLYWYFLRKGNMRLKAKNIKLDFILVGSFIVLGISSFITQVANTALQIILNNSLVYYGNLSHYGGDVALSAMGIVLKVSMILIAIDIGIGTGAQPIWGFNEGANKPKRIKETYLLAVKIATIFSILGWITCIFFPHIILQIFGTDDPLFTEFAVESMRIFMSGVFLAGAQIISTSYFQATGQPIKASVLSLLRQIILLVPLVLILPLFFGIYGILYAGAIADISSGIIVLFFAAKEMKKLNKRIAESEQ